MPDYILFMRDKTPLMEFPGKSGLSFQRLHPYRFSVLPNLHLKIDRIGRLIIIWHGANPIIDSFDQRFKLESDERR